MKIDVYLEKVENHYLRQVKNAVKIINSAQNYFHIEEIFNNITLIYNEKIN